MNASSKTIQEKTLEIGSWRVIQGQFATPWTKYNAPDLWGLYLANLTGAIIGGVAGIIIIVVVVLWIAKGKGKCKTKVTTKCNGRKTVKTSGVLMKD